jgi:uncharacterized protein YggE
MESQNFQGFWGDHKAHYGKVVLTLTAAVVVFLAVKTISAIKEFGYIGADSMNRGLITVSGESEVFATPDIASFTFTITKEDASVEKAQDDVNQRATNILNFLKKEGVAEKDIKNLSYDIYPRYDYRNNRCFNNGVCLPETNRVFVGYEVTQTIAVKVRKISDAGKIIGGLGTLGINNISGLTFDIDQKDALIAKARNEAIKKARGKAAELSKALGVRLVRLVNYTDNGYYPPPIPAYAKANTAFARGDTGTASEAALPTGENKIIANITLTYEIR